MSSPEPAAARIRPSKMAPPATANGADPSAAPTALLHRRSGRRTSPFLPTRLEAALLAVYPALLLFGALFALLSPETRHAPYDAAARTYVPAADQAAHGPGATPSYFARKDNVLNVLFVKRGWGWVTAAFVLFVATHPALRTTAARVRAAARWALLTAWWVLVTQWCFGPPLIDRGFTWTGGKCEAAAEKVAEEGIGGVEPAVALSAAACRTVGGRWHGGHDISGHVFLLVLGSFFLVQEVGWVVLRAGWTAGGAAGEDRSVVMGDGAVKGAGVEAEGTQQGSTAPAGTLFDVLGLGGKAAAALVLLSLWMILMTAIYFHTWFEKLTGLLVALTGLYAVYILPRWLPALRGLVGLPGI